MEDLKFTELVKTNVPKGWESVFENCEHEFKDLAFTLDSHEWFPKKCDLFNAFHHTPLQDVKVVIIGQDPYPQRLADGRPRAVGMSFSVDRNDTVPSSLNNVYKVLSKTIPGFTKPYHGDLTNWARQGVLMLNMCLTVKPGAPGSHKIIWLGFIRKVLLAINEANPRCIYLLWGREAQKIKQFLSSKAIILETSHPSGLSANRGFLDCNHFNEVNQYLKDLGKTEIDWNAINDTSEEIQNPVILQNISDNFNKLKESLENTHQVTISVTNNSEYHLSYKKDDLPQITPIIQ